MPTDPRVGEEGGREGASCWRWPFTVGFGMYEWVVGEDGGAEGDRQGKHFFSLPFSFGSALSWNGRKFLAYAYTTATNK